MCLRERERRERSFLFSGKYENNSWCSRMGNGGSEKLKNWCLKIEDEVRR